MTKQITQEEYANVMSLIKATNKAWRNMNDLQQIILDMVEPYSKASEERLIATIMDACCNYNTFEEAKEYFDKWSRIVNKDTDTFNDVSVLIMYEGGAHEDGEWVARCLEYDVSSTGRTLDHVKEIFDLNWHCEIEGTALEDLRDEASQVYHYAFNNLLHHPSEDGEAWFYTP